MIDLPIVKNHMVDHIVRGRNRIENKANSETRRELASFDAVTKSRLSLHLVHLESTIRKHNMMFQRNHQISDELSRKMRNLQLFSTENKLKSRVSQMLQLDAVQATKTLKFKDAGKKVKGMLRAHKLGFGPMSEDEREDTRQMIKSNKYTEELLDRSQLYRQLLLDLQSCVLLTTLNIVRVPRDSLRHIDLLAATTSKMDEEIFEPEYEIQPDFLPLPNITLNYPV